MDHSVNPIRQDVRDGQINRSAGQGFLRGEKKRSKSDGAKNRSCCELTKMEEDAIPAGAKKLAAKKKKEKNYVRN